MGNTVLTLGLVCITAAIVGGGLKAFKIEVPVIASVKRQLLLAGFGIVLLAGFGVVPPGGRPPKKTLRDLQEKFEYDLRARQHLYPRSQNGMDSLVEELNSGHVPYVKLMDTARPIEFFKDYCDDFDTTLSQLKVDFPDMTELIHERETESRACRAEFDELNKEMNSIKEMYKSKEQ